MFDMIFVQLNSTQNGKKLVGKSRPPNSSLNHTTPSQTALPFNLGKWVLDNIPRGVIRF